jgi:hypothetical protein
VTTQETSGRLGSDSPGLPLSGITVISVEQAVAAPFATRQLADLGARVIKIERPGVGDFARNYDETVKGMASYFVWLNRGKQSLSLDLKSNAARSILTSLIDRAEVFVQNLAPGATARMGFSAQSLRARDERLIACGAVQLAVQNDRDQPARCVRCPRRSASVVRAPRWGRSLRSVSTPTRSSPNSDSARPRSPRCARRGRCDR